MKKKKSVNLKHNFSLYIIVGFFIVYYNENMKGNCKLFYRNSKGSGGGCNEKNV